MNIQMYLKKVIKKCKKVKIKNIKNIVSHAHTQTQTQRKKVTCFFVFTIFIKSNTFGIITGPLLKSKSSTTFGARSGLTLLSLVWVALFYPFGAFSKRKYAFALYVEIQNKFGDPRDLTWVLNFVLKILKSNLVWSKKYTKVSKLGEQLLTIWSWLWLFPPPNFIQVLQCDKYKRWIK